MTSTPRRERFRALLCGSRCVYPASVFDPVSARIAEDLGFETGMFAGSVASFTVLGAPDLIVLSLSELADQARRICRAGALPLMVDADHGYGNALNVRRTVEELETAGVAGLSIEDTLLPPPYGGDEVRLISVEEGVGKVRAALDARQDAGLAIAGRTSALKVTGLDDAIARGRAYEAAGVDAMFFTGARTRAQIETLRSAIRVPIILGDAGPDIMDLDFLGGQGVRICIQGHQPFLAAVRAVHETLKALREGIPPSKLAGVAPPALLKQVTRDEDYRGWIRKYLGGG